MKTTEKNIPISSEIGIPFLPEPYKSVARLRILEKKSYSDIANEVEISESYARKCVFRAKRKLFILDKMLKRFKGNDEKLEKLLNKWKKLNIEEKYMRRVSKYDENGNYLGEFFIDN